MMLSSFNDEIGEGNEDIGDDGLMMKITTMLRQ